MNRILIMTLSVFLVAGLLLTGCGEVPETQPTLQTQPTETSAPTEALPTETEPAETEAQEECFLLTLAGDCTLGNEPAHDYAPYAFRNQVGEDYGYPFANVIDYLESDDFTLVNLEGVLCEGGHAANKEYTFRGSPSYVKILTENSVEAVTLANNHTLDFGRSGYDSTTTALEEAGLPYVERDGSALVTTESGLTIGLYAVAFTLDEEDMAAAFADLRERGAEIILFAAHWGTEYSYTPGSEQQRMAYAAIDAGADIVYGAHPHVLQPIEEYNGGIIFYSLGNFCFGGNMYPRDHDSVLVQQEVIRKPDGSVCLGELTVIPVSISSVSGRNNYQPTPYEPGSAEYDRVLEKLGLDLP